MVLLAANSFKNIKSSLSCRRSYVDNISNSSYDVDDIGYVARDSIELSLIDWNKKWMDQRMNECMYAYIMYVYIMYVCIA
jgi:hypothetical protein